LWELRTLIRSPHSVAWAGYEKFWRSGHIQPISILFSVGTPRNSLADTIRPYKP